MSHLVSPLVTFDEKFISTTFKPQAIKEIYQLKDIQGTALKKFKLLLRTVV